MNIIEYIFEHSQTPLNIYFQQGQTLPRPLISPNV